MVCRLAPTHVKAWQTLCRLCLRRSDYERIVVEAPRFLSVAPDDPDLLMATGASLFRLQRLEHAYLVFRKLVELVADHPTAKANLAIVCFLTQRLDEAWKLDLSVRLRSDQAARLNTLLPLWGAGAPEGAPLLVWGDQGPGDQIRYLGLLPELKWSGPVIVSVTNRLLDLCRRSFPEIPFLAAEPETFDGERVAQLGLRAHFPLSSLGRIRRTDIHDFGNARPAYLRPDQSRSDRIRDTLETFPGSRSIAITWRTFSTDKRKTSRLPDWLPIIGSPRVKVVNVQYGNVQSEIDRLRAVHDVPLITVESLDLSNDLDGLAALLSACDIVVGIRTTTTILAAALGRPVVMVTNTGTKQMCGLPYDPWFPSMRCVICDDLTNVAAWLPQVQALVWELLESIP